MPKTEGRRPGVPFSETAALVGTLAGAYVVSQFLRNSIGVIAPNLADELNLSAAEIGLLSSVFFFAFAAAQIPLGVALDRYGPKRCMLVCAGVTVASTTLFALAPSPAWLIAARILMGLGTSCFLMAPLSLYAQRYAPDRFATLVGLQIGLGTLGTLLATAPYALAVAAVGWRVSFFGVALAMLVAGVLIAVVVREERRDRADARRESLRSSLAGMVVAIRAPSFWPVFAMQLACYSSFVLVVGLWGGPYLTHIYGYDLTERGNMLFVAVAAQIVASFLWGPADRLFRSYKLPVLSGTLATAAVLLLPAVVGMLPPAILFLWFVAVGAFPACVSVLIAHGKALYPPELAGRALTLFNMATIGGVFFTQSATGLLIDLFPESGGGYALGAYRAVFIFQSVVILLTSLAYFFSRDPWQASETKRDRSV